MGQKRSSQVGDYPMADALILHTEGCTIPGDGNAQSLRQLAATWSAMEAASFTAPATSADPNVYILLKAKKVPCKGAIEGEASAIPSRHNCLISWPGGAAGHSVFG